MNRLILKQIIADQNELFDSRKFISRKFPDNLLSTSKIVVITGVRRAGKSTLLKQISESFPNFNYFNFDDERLTKFEISDFNVLLEIFYELNPNSNVFFFDEIQEVDGWEKFVNRLFESGKKIFITGSNAKLLSSEISTSLTGRNLQLELYPFSFKEYLSFNGLELKTVYSTKENANLVRHFNYFFTIGGFPEVVKSKDRQELIQIYQDILIKDLIVRFKIRDVKAFKELGIYLLSNVGNRLSYNNLKNLLEFKSTSQVKRYVEFFEQSYLFFTTNKFDTSLRKQLINNRKVYCVDHGIVRTAGFHPSENNGNLLENLVFTELKRRKIGEIYYYSNKGECDFLIKQGTSVIRAIQVCYNLTSENKNREVNSLIEAMQKFNLKEGLILTLNQKEELQIQTSKIIIKPIYAWLLEN